MRSPWSPAGGLEDADRRRAGVDRSTLGLVRLALNPYGLSEIGWV
jgi:hypothetical protein